VNSLNTTAIHDLAHLPTGLSIELDSGQIFALARESVLHHGGSYLDTVNDIDAALKYLRKHVSPCSARPPKGSEK